MSFLQYLKKQTKRDDSIGDLARDALQDHAKPKGRVTLEQWLDYLSVEGACLGAIDALERAWHEYEETK